MLKLFLCTVIIAAAAGAGMLKAQTYTNREEHLSEFISVLKILESDMAYRMDPIPVLFQQTGEKTQGYAGSFLLAVCRYLDEFPYSGSFSDAWEKAGQVVYGESTLTKEDIQVINEIGIDLGKTDIGNQKSLFEHACNRLERQRKEAEEDKRVKGKMYRSLGAACGILIVVILL